MHPHVLLSPMQSAFVICQAGSIAVKMQMEM